MARQRQAAKSRGTPDDFFVELATPKGSVFSASASAFEFSALNAVLQAEPRRVFYFGSISSGELSLRLGREFRFFAIFRASARIVDRHLTVMAEIIEPLSAPSGEYLEAPPRSGRKLRGKLSTRTGFSKSEKEKEQRKEKP